MTQKLGAAENVYESPTTAVVLSRIFLAELLMFLQDPSRVVRHTVFWSTTVQGSEERLELSWGIHQLARLAWT